MDASTLLVVFLLVSAASLASYLLSQWSPIRDSDRSLGWAAISIGTTLLLATAAIAVLTVGLLPKLRFSPSNEPAEQLLKSAQFGDATAEPVLERQDPPTEASNATIRPVASSDRGVTPAAPNEATPSIALRSRYRRH
jgi:hypothetical protein